MIVNDEIMHCLSSKTRIRSVVKDLSSVELEKMIGLMGAILDEKKEKVKADAVQKKAKQSSIDAINKLINEKGLSLDDFGVGHTKKSRNIQRYNFEYSTLSGDRVEWMGALTGRVPKEFQQYLQRTGKKRADCIISSVD